MRDMIHLTVSERGMNNLALIDRRRPVTPKASLPGIAASYMRHMHIV